MCVRVIMFFLCEVFLISRLQIQVRKLNDNKETPDKRRN